MNNDIYQALDRTALLVERDIFENADHRLIIDGLRGTTARIIANKSNLDSIAGQTALVTLYGQLAMLGLQIDLDVPSVRLVSHQPPLRSHDLAEAIADYSDDLMPGGSSKPSPVPDVTFALGDTPAPPNAIQVGGAAWRAEVGQSAQPSAWRGEMPVGAMAAAAAAAADGLRAALPRIAERLDRPMPVDAPLLLDAMRRVSIDLSDYEVGEPLHLGDVDVISGGAITNAALYALLRVPGVTASVRVFEPDVLDHPNLNRYGLARLSQMGMLKAEALTAFSGDGLKVAGRPIKVDESTLASIVPLAPRVLIGVDHIPSRWSVQRAAFDRWVCVGATSHFFVLVSSHPSGGPCAGCVHPRDEDIVGEIPTASFVSLWAGLLQALELVRRAAGGPKAIARSTNVWPLGLAGRRGIQTIAQSAVAVCPVQCRASRAAIGWNQFSSAHARSEARTSMVPTPAGVTVSSS